MRENVTSCLQRLEVLGEDISALDHKFVDRPSPPPRVAPLNWQLSIPFFYRNGNEDA